jgi:hypothetical protein
MVAGGGIMRGYMLALAVSIGVFAAGLLSGYLCIHLLGASPEALLMAVLRTPSAQATVTRVEAVSQAVQAVAESMAKAVTPQPGRSIIHEWPVRYLSTALGIFSTNMLTALGAAVTPILPVLWHRRVSPLLARISGRSYDPAESWRSYFRYMVPFAPVAILGFNGLMVSIVTSIAGLMAFMMPELAGILCLSAIGVRAALNSGSPESVEASYAGFWRVAGLSALLLAIAALMEARLLV